MQLIREVRFQNADRGFQNERISLFGTAEYPMFAMEAHGSCVSYPERTFVSPAEVTMP